MRAARSTGKNICRRKVTYKPDAYRAIAGPRSKNLWRNIMLLKYCTASRLLAVFTLVTLAFTTVAEAQMNGQGQGSSGNMMGGGTGGGWGWGMGSGIGGVGGIGVVVLALVVLAIAVLAFRRRRA